MCMHQIPSFLTLSLCFAYLLTVGLALFKGVVVACTNTRNRLQMTEPQFNSSHSGKGIIPNNMSSCNCMAMHFNNPLGTSTGTHIHCEDSRDTGR